MGSYLLDDTPLVSNPTRFYLPHTTGAAAAVSPAYGSAWDIIGLSAARLATGIAKTNTNLVSETAADFAETSATEVNLLHKQYVSDPLPQQTISGKTFKAAVRGGSASAPTSKPYLQVVMRIVSNDGTVERGILFDPIAVAGNTTVGALGERFSGTTSTRIIPASTPLNTIDVQANDRLVIEIGQRFDNLTATSANGYMQFGDATATADLNFASEVSSAAPPWVELDFDIFGAAPSGPILTETGAALLLE